MAPKALPSRPNLDHLRRQAKTLLEELRDGRASAIQAFIEHLPEAKHLKPAAIRGAGFRLADAQSVVARRSGFASWPGLARHVKDLRALEGEWRFASLEVDGSQMPAAATAESRLLIDGDRFQMLSPEGTYDGIFTIDVDARPPRIDIEFVEGPEAGNRSEGVYALEPDAMTLCLGLAGAARPKAFVTSRGSGHALERLRRVSNVRPANVTGGTRRETPAKTRAAVTAVDPSTFDGPITPMMRRLEGEWDPVKLVIDGKPMPDQWLAYGSRTMTGNEMKVVFGGQTMAHAKVRIDERASPVAVEYLNLHGSRKGSVSLGIMEWIGDEVLILMAAPGEPRPRNFAAVPPTATLSRWRKRARERQ